MIPWPIPRTSSRRRARGRSTCIRTAASSTSPTAMPAGRLRGKEGLDGGENNVAVFSIDQQTGEPTQIQTIEGLAIICAISASTRADACWSPPPSRRCRCATARAETVPPGCSPIASAATASSRSCASTTSIPAGGRSSGAGWRRG